jgi:hypothetical protein
MKSLNLSLYTLMQFLRTHQPHVRRILNNYVPIPIFKTHYNKESYFKMCVCV